MEVCGVGILSERLLRGGSKNGVKIMNDHKTTDDLDYEKHLEHYKRLFGYYVDNPDMEKPQVLNAAEEEAKHHHAICVFDPLRDLIYATTSLAEKLTNKNAKYFLLYGAARRTQLIFEAFRKIRSRKGPKTQMA